jgi:hypothetical protein
MVGNEKYILSEANARELLMIPENIKKVKPIVINIFSIFKISIPPKMTPGHIGVTGVFTA